MKMKNDEDKPDWLSAIDDEAAADADRWKALLDLMGESMDRGWREPPFSLTMGRLSERGIHQWR